jgi:hypothetical protein
MHHLALRPEHAAQLQQLPPRAVDRADPPGRRRAPHALLQILDQLAQTLEDPEVVVDQGVDQTIGEIVAAPFAQRAGGAPETLADRIEAVARTLLEGQDEALPEHERDLLGEQAVVPVGQAQHDEQVVVVALNLGALIDVDDVGDGQRVQAAALAERADQLEVGKALHVEPDLGREGRRAVDLGERLAVPLGKLLGVVGDELEARGQGVRRPEYRAARPAQMPTTIKQARDSPSSRGRLQGRSPRRAALHEQSSTAARRARPARKVASANPRGVARNRYPIDRPLRLIDPSATNVRPGSRRRRPWKSWSCSRSWR